MSHSGAVIVTHTALPVFTNACVVSVCRAKLLGQRWAQLPTKEKEIYFERHRTSAAEYKAAVTKRITGCADPLLVPNKKKMRSLRALRRRQPGKVQKHGRGQSCLKKPLSAFLYFSQEERARLRRQKKLVFL